MLRDWIKSRLPDLHAMPEVRYPSREEVRWHMQQSARMRSEAVHALLHRTVAWVGGGEVVEHVLAGRYGIPSHLRAA
jgi:hypothetical protein